MAESPDLQRAVEAYVSRTASKGTASTQTTNDLTHFHRFRPASPTFRYQKQPPSPFTSLLPTSDKAVETIRYIPENSQNTTHNRGNSLPTRKLGQKESERGRKRTIVGGVITTNGEFLKVETT